MDYFMGHIDLWIAMIAQGGGLLWFVMKYALRIERRLMRIELKLGIEE